ncbi:hypothetical protein [Lysinibacillus sp. NPDC092081]|uniref:hypothetical protein n=1 Tax=Lysinibacillus sp. NPDC092081 TaxID=3364131 RepID=UPI00382AB55B
MQSILIEKAQLPKTLIIEQGQELGKDGSVHVHIKSDDGKLTISISGTAVYVKELKVQI